MGNESTAVIDCIVWYNVERQVVWTVDQSLNISCRGGNMQVCRPDARHPSHLTTPSCSGSSVLSSSVFDCLACVLIGDAHVVDQNQ